MKRLSTIALVIYLVTLADLVCHRPKERIGPKPCMLQVRIYKDGESEARTRAWGDQPRQKGNS